MCAVIAFTSSVSGRLTPAILSAAVLDIYSSYEKEVGCRAYLA